MAVYSDKNKVFTRVGIERITVVSGTTREYNTAENIADKSIHLTINGLENFEGVQFTINNNRIIFELDCILVEGDIIDIRYNY